MKIFLTGGSGDLGKILSHHLEKRGDTAVRFDVRTPTDSFGNFFAGSILDRKNLSNALKNSDCIIHIAAWHGFHEFTKSKNSEEFWDLNVTGTYNVFQAALEQKIKKIVYISSESVAERQGMYGWTKRMGEEIAQHFVDQHQMNVVTLRPRAFIPYWNHDVYSSYVEWAKWFWKGAVHINDVAQAVLLSIDFLASHSTSQHLILPVDGAYEFTQEDLMNWDQEGAGETFKKYYAEYFNLAKKFGLDPTQKPSIQNIEDTKNKIHYHPTFSLKNVLEELSKYGEKGPPFNLEK
jgi:UDP-glucose 4-epimerase